VPAGVARLGSWLVEIAAGEKRVAMMTYALILEIGEPECGLHQHHQQQRRLGQLHR